VVREGVGVGGEMNQALYAHMNNKKRTEMPEASWPSMHRTRHALKVGEAL
jgi:hypothetical protein